MFYNLKYQGKSNNKSRKITIFAQVLTKYGQKQTKPIVIME